jgi:hypothetical protein
LFRALKEETFSGKAARPVWGGIAASPLCALAGSSSSMFHAQTARRQRIDTTFTR